MQRLALSCIVGLTGACAPREREVPLVGVEVAGCLDVIDEPTGSICELDGAETQRIHVWIPGSVPEARSDGSLLQPVELRAVDDGWHFKLVIPTGAAGLTLSRPDAPHQRWTLPFSWKVADEPSALTQAQAAMSEAYIQSRTQECQRAAEQVFDLAEAQRRGLNALLAARVGVECSGGADTRAWPTAADRVPTGADDREVIRAALEASYFVRVGALPEALTSVGRGLRHSLRLGMPNASVELLSMRAIVLTELGDFRGAIEAFHAIFAIDTQSGLDPCVLASMHVNLGWVLLQSAERTQTASLVDAETELRRGITLVSDPINRCRAEDLALTRLNLVRVLQVRSDWKDAERELAAVVPDLRRVANTILDAELHLLRARARLAANDLVAAEAAIGLAEASAGLPNDLLLELLVTRGEIAEGRGAYPQARDAFQLAHRRALERLRYLSPTGGQQRFLFDRRRAVQRLVDLSQRVLDDPAAAFRSAREATSAEARQLSLYHPSSGDRREYLTWRADSEQALLEQWDLPREHHRRLLASTRREALLREAIILGEADLSDPSNLGYRDPEPGELLLLYFPISARRLFGFGVTTEGATVVTIDLEHAPASLGDGTWTAGQLQSWSDLLLTPLGDAIDRAERIRVLPSFGLQSLPFHALPWRDRPLLVHAPVEYSLDLPVRDVRGHAALSHVLVVGDPGGDLDGARKEAETVSAHLQGLKTEVTTLLGRAATGPAVRDLLPRVQHLHYAGHSATAGEFGWESTLRLAEDTSLTIADIAALEQVPRTVSLLSCDGGAVEADPRSQGISLATAFLLAGSDAVIALSTDLAAAEAPILAAALHTRQAEVWDMSTTYRTAMLRLLGEPVSSATWQALRLWVP